MEAHRNRLYLKAIPSRKKLLRKKSRKTISRTKNAEKLESWKVKRSETKFIEGKNTLNYFFLTKSMEKNSLKKAGKSVLSIQKPMEKHICISNSMKHKRCWWKSTEINFIRENPRNSFPFRRRPQKWTSCTKKPRKLISSMEICKNQLHQLEIGGNSISNWNDEKKQFWLNWIPWD